MIYFQVKPDEVFSAILRDALIAGRLAIQELMACSREDDWEFSYPLISQWFTPAQALQSLELLLAASGDAEGVYRLQDFHWIMLYEFVRQFCDRHNELVRAAAAGFRAVGGYELPEIEFDDLVRIYFWDTDFLLPQDRVGPVGVEGWHTLGITEELLGGSALWRSDSTDLRIERVEVPLWREVEPEEWFHPESRRYPDPGWD